MMRFPKFGPMLLALIATTRPVDASGATFHAGQVVMGTILQVTVVTEGSSRGQQMTNRAIELARHWDDVLTTWRPDGELARLNATAGRGPKKISRDLASALAAMIRLSDETYGAFDPGVGPLVAAYSKAGADAKIPTFAFRIRDVLTLDEGFAELSANASLDAGGIGKGLALDAVADELRKAGATGAYLDFGGSSQIAFGTMENGEPWTLALAGLRPGVGHGLIRLDAALSTSRTRAIGDETGPIVDPRTGAPVSSPRFVTCQAATAAQAEACSKAFIVRGWGAVEMRTRFHSEVLYEDADVLQMSSGFARMLAVDPERYERERVNARDR